MVFYLIILLGNYLSRYILVMNFQSLRTSFLKGIQICDDFQFFIVIETSSHILWHAINKHGKIIIYNYEKN
jgi:hypothetical protein